MEPEASTSNSSSSSSSSPIETMISSSSQTQAQTQAKKGFLSRLRRTPSTSPYTQPTHAASTSAVISINQANSKTASSIENRVVKKNQVGVPIMMGMNRSEEIFGPSTSVKHGFGIEDELEWERVRTLPRVRLVPPPEEQTEPIMLYPPPHMVRPSTPPPILPHPFLSPPSSPPTSPPRLSTRPGSPPQSPPKRPQSIYSQSPTWAGMADGFVLPPPKFSRNSTGWSSTAFGGNNIVMPKKRAEVNEDRRKRMSAVIGSPPRSPPAIVVSGMMRSLESQEEIAANKRMRVDEEVKVVQPIKEHTLPNIIVDGSTDLTSPPIDMDIDQVPIAPSIPDISSPSSPILSLPEAAAPPQSETVQPQPQPKEKAKIPASPTKTPVPKAVRRSRALSLSAAFSSSSSLKSSEVPPLPDLPSRPPIRKQKSLKKFFFSSSTPPDIVMASSSAPPLPDLPLQERNAVSENVATKEDKEKREDKPSKGKKILQRARSKPSLKIDVKVAKPSSSISPSPATPALSTGRTDISVSQVETPSSAPANQPRGLSKRFSLSNMSQAFKKKSHSTPVSATASSGSPIPMVPDLPEVYKKQKDIKGKVLESAVPISPRKSKTVDSADTTNEILTPTGLPRRSDSLKAIQSLTFTQEEEPTSQQPNLDETVSPSILTEEPQSLLPAFEVSSVSTSATASGSRSRDRSDSPDLSVKSISTIDIDDIDASTDIDGDLEDEQELIHAQLMHVSPRTRRDPTQSISLQEFLSSPPGKTSNVVIVPTKGLRRSVEAVVVLGNPSLYNLQSPPFTSASEPIQEVEKEEEANSSIEIPDQHMILERRGSETESEETISTPMEDYTETFPSNPNQVLENDEEPTPKASSSRISQQTIIQNVSANGNGIEDGNNDFNFDLQSLPSDIVLVETPPQLPNVPCNTEVSTSTTQNTNTPNTLKNRFVSPEALLKRLHSSRKQQQHPTPYPHHSKKGSGSNSTRNKDKDENKENTHRESMISFKDIPLPPLPISSELDQFSSLKREMQLRSLKFESLGLNFQEWNERQLEDLLANA
ncbi:uncharacterized protein L201_001784 [Kwoniella dendrophila CBS 6074]|uniref:Uncharacterized protein n=1 Tax=Kwoniella dendrophila CBS 6074 TaxID=1295534 RepID=A0AAX4JNA9_9TREE